MPMNVLLKRAYDPPAQADGLRVLVDRLWPRGLRKDAAKIDRWLKEIAPSVPLRKWFHQDPDRWAEFRDIYRRELAQNPHLVTELLDLAGCDTVTLVYAARNESQNNAVVLKQFLYESRAALTQPLQSQTGSPNISSTAMNA